jgi:hypothetical protein
MFSRNAVNQAVAEDWHEVADYLPHAGLERNDGQPFPTLDTVLQALTDDQYGFLAERMEQGITDRLVVAPRLGDLTLDRFLENTGQGIASHYWYPMDEYTNAKITRDPVLHNQSTESGWSVGVCLVDPTDERGGLLPNAGLMFPGLNYYRQKRMAEKEQKAFEAEGLDVKPITVPELVVGKRVFPKLGRGTTRLIHLGTPNIFRPAPRKGANGPMRVLGGFVPGGHPGVLEYEGRHLFIGTSAFRKDPAAGVRRVLRII